MGNNTSPHPIDVYVGERIRVLRHLRGISQHDLAHRCGVRFQQIQKYETAANRVSSSRLVMIAKVLRVGVADLFGKFAGVDVVKADDPVFNDRRVGNLIREFIRLDDNGRGEVYELMRQLRARQRKHRRKSPGRR